MSTFFNNAVFLDYSSIPYNCSFTNLSTYRFDSSFALTDQGSFQIIPTIINDGYYTILSGTMFFLTKSSKFVVLPKNPTLGTVITLLDTSSTSAHTIGTIDSSLIQNSPSYTVFPTKSVSLIFDGSNWQILATQ